MDKNPSVSKWFGHIGVSKQLGCIGVRKRLGHPGVSKGFGHLSVSKRLGHHSVIWLSVGGWIISGEERGQVILVSVSSQGKATHCQ